MSQVCTNTPASPVWLECFDAVCSQMTFCERNVDYNIPSRVCSFYGVKWGYRHASSPQLNSGSYSYSQFFDKQWVLCCRLDLTPHLLSQPNANTNVDLKKSNIFIHYFWVINNSSSSSLKCKESGFQCDCVLIVYILYGLVQIEHRYLNVSTQQIPSVHVFYCSNWWWFE